MTGAIVLVLRLLALAALYAFLGTVLWIMWQSLRRSSEAAGLSRIPKLQLEIRLKGHRPAARIFNQPDVLIGRDPLADISLRDSAVSSRHARLSFHDGQWWIDDLGSTNGTRLNRERVTGPTVLVTGDVVKCGSSRILVTLPTGRQIPSDARGGLDE